MILYDYRYKVCGCKVSTVHRVSVSFINSRFFFFSSRIQMSVEHLHRYEPLFEGRGVRA